MNNPLKGFKEMSVPKKKKRVAGRAWMADAVLAFADTGSESMGKRFDSVDEAKRAYRSAKSFIAHSDVDCVEVALRGDMLFFIRKEQ